ncbi:hypothetical protein ES703_60931 [subsurface metagenome]
MRPEIQFEEDPEDVPTEPSTPRVVRHYNPPAGAAVTRPSDAIECPHCKCVTWVWADTDWADCRLCGLRFFNRAGKWFLRAGGSSTKKAATPEE